MRLTTAIFDMDGLLLDSERLLINEWLAAAERRQIPLAAEQLIPSIGLVGKACADLLAAAVGGHSTAPSIRDEIHLRYAQGVIQPGLRPGARQLLGRLHQQRVRCAVASSSPVAQIEHRLGQHDLLRYLGSWAGGDEVPNSKPDPDVYLLAAERLKVAPAQCLAFEDSDHGAEAALAAGMQVVLVPDLKIPPPDLRHRCLHVADSLDELGDWVIERLVG